MDHLIRFIPNFLSALRLILAALFPFVPEQWWLLLIVSGGSSDVLDGWIARRYQVQSRLGGMLDAVADKLFVLIALLTVAGGGKFSLCWVPLLLARDLLVAFTAAYAVAIRSWQSFNQMDVRWSGKLATGGQFLLLLVTVVLPVFIVPALLFASLLSVFAAFDYGRLFVLELRRRSMLKTNGEQ